METLNNGIREKFSGLLFFLRRSKSDFEMVADEIEDQSLRSALNVLSDESNYYAGELKTYLKAFGFYPNQNDTAPPDIDMCNSSYTGDVPEKGDELQIICSYNEESLTKAYSELLAESMPFQVLKDLMNCQLNALKYTFMKIKALNSARFTSYQLH